MRQRRPDVAKARSLVRAAEMEMDYLATVTPSEASASTLVRGVYENFRRLGDALLAIKGLESADHIQAIAQLTALVNVKTARPLPVLDNLRKLRHDINYHGYIPSMADLEDVLSIRDSCWAPILKEVKKQVGQATVP
ncbi:hypothetical protein HY642_01375 [Candidatus Woesearchaeota archaeon]|nr:hypothetical protein [Candidatus Woesearchaeota archaeon]